MTRGRPDNAGCEIARSIFRGCGTWQINDVRVGVFPITRHGLLSVNHSGTPGPTPTPTSFAGGGFTRGALSSAFQNVGSPRSRAARAHNAVPHVEEMATRRVGCEKKRVSFGPPPRRTKPYWECRWTASRPGAPASAHLEQSKQCGGSPRVPIATTTTYLPDAPNASPCQHLHPAAPLAIPNLYCQVFFFFFFFFPASATT